MSDKPTVKDHACFLGESCKICHPHSELHLPGCPTRHSTVAPCMCVQHDRPTGLHKDCPDEDGKCFMNREADCRAFEPTGLTDEQINNMAVQFYGGLNMQIPPRYFDYTKFVEAIVRKDEEEKARFILWTGHGCDGLYGDDREQQCNRCHIDFKRDPLPTIIKRLSEARKDERAKARQHIWVRKGVQRAECCRAALEDARVTLRDEK